VVLGIGDPGRHQESVLNVKRWDMVHIVAKDEQQARQVNMYGDEMPTAHVVIAVCGRRAKIYPYGRNKLTEDAPTCIVCIAGGYRDGQD
jgi:hypothetical protein